VPGTMCCSTWNAASYNRSDTYADRFATGHPGGGTHRVATIMEPWITAIVIVAAVVVVSGICLYAAALIIERWDKDDNRWQ